MRGFRAEWKEQEEKRVDYQELDKLGNKERRDGAVQICNQKLMEQVAGFFLMISKSASSGLVLRLYSFSNVSSLRLSLNSRFMAATKPGCHCIFVSSITTSLFT